MKQQTTLHQNLIANTIFCHLYTSDSKISISDDVRVIKQ